MCNCKNILRKNPFYEYTERSGGGAEQNQNLIE